MASFVSKYYSHIQYATKRDNHVTAFVENALYLSLVFPQNISLNQTVTRHSAFGSQPSVFEFPIVDYVEILSSQAFASKCPPRLVFLTITIGFCRKNEILSI